MEENLIEIREFTSPGYQPVIDFGEWRVPILNYLDEILPQRIEFIERDNKTDEVFELEKGKGILFLGEGNSPIISILSQVLEPGKIYNVKRIVWHTVVLSRDGSVLIVENRNTSDWNSDHLALNPEQQRVIIEISRREHLYKRNM